MKEIIIIIIFNIKLKSIFCATKTESEAGLVGLLLCYGFGYTGSDIIFWFYDHLFQGCTATVLLVWADGNDSLFAQCANVGDSACIIKYVFLLLLCID